MTKKHEIRQKNRAGKAKAKRERCYVILTKRESRAALQGKKYREQKNGKTWKANDFMGTF